MSAIRIGGSTVSCRPCPPIHHLNVDKQCLRSAGNAASCQSGPGDGGVGEVCTGAFLYLLFVALLPLSATYPSPAASISLPFHYYRLSIFCSHFFPLPGYDSHWCPWTRLIISPSILLQVKIISSAFLQPLHTPLWLNHGAVILQCLFSCRHCSVFHAASPSSIYLLIKINNLCCASSSTHHSWSPCFSMCICRLFISPQPLFTISRFPPPSLSPVYSAVQSGSSMLIEFKAIISKKKSQQGFYVLSNFSGLVWAFFIQ